MLDADMKSRLLANWEAAVREIPDIAKRAGPPNWLVLERQKPGEDFHQAAARVKAEYFPTVDKPVNRGQATVDIAPTVDKAVDMCADCGQHPKAPQRTKCWACIKKAQRG